jgi:AcrR family transcriptional regulator
MPRISAPTVAQHRAAQHRALLDAAAAIIAEEGVAAVTPRSVGERAGLARSSFYEYFPSRDDLLAAVAVQAFDDWADEVAAATSAASPGRARLRAYVEATIRMAADGKHELATALQQAELAPTSLETIMAMHDRLSGPLVRLLDEAGVPEPETQAALIQGVVGAGLQLFAHGAPEPEVRRAVLALLDAGVPWAEAD